MTIGAIGSYPYSYQSYVQYQYFGTSLSNDQIKSLLEKYGIDPTGDSSADLQALYDEMYMDAEMMAKVIQSSPNQPSQSSQATEAQNSGNVPWATLMSQVGLWATGDLATDYKLFNDKIQLMQLGATTPTERASINQLEAQASIVFVKQDQSIKQDSSQGPNSSQSQTVSGADIQAQLNKLFLLGY